MAVNRYSRYKIAIEVDSKKVQGLREGDLVRRQYFDTPNLIYSLMVVTETGVDIIAGKESHYFVGALLDGDEPQNGELLDFVRVTNLIDRSRGGALYLTASDSESPYMDVIDGLGFEHSLLSISEPRKTTSQFTFPISGKVSNPEMLLISFRVRASKNITGAKLSIGYSDETDGEDSFDITADWSYRLSAIIMDYPEQYARTLTINPNLSGDEWCEVSDLNVVRLSDIATFAKATKARMGRITGIIDPVFGMLDGYGAYFQNLYATRNVNIAGTFTAGDENGFASTFYVGKIHKNVILNSVECAFTNSAVVDIPTPVGLGKVRRISTDNTLAVQSSDWRMERVGRMYCFSLWIRSELGEIAFYQDEHRIGSLMTEVVGEWRRYKIAFAIKSSTAKTMSIRLTSDLKELLVTAPQLESGENASQYQPTDGRLNYTEDYGAWFSKGGIGGTIQNPLLKLNEDGSISSCDESFVINRDGTGHFASGSLRWNKDSVQLGDNVKLEWVNFSDSTKEIIKEYVQNSDLPDWVSDWNSSKTVIDAQSVITPKIFTGTKNTNGTITGIAIGKFGLNTRDASGTIIKETVNGIYGFCDGKKSFEINATGDTQLGNGNEYIKYNASLGRIEFGSAVSMQWIGATYIDAAGIFTGILSANTVNAININASQITSGVIDSTFIDTESLKSILITAENINALTLNAKKGKIGDWNIGSMSIYRGTETNLLGNFTSKIGDITIGSAGIRGWKWRLDSWGSGAIAAGNISWDITGKVTFNESVILQWMTPITALNDSLGGDGHPKLTHISSTGIYTGTLTANQITAGTIDSSRINVEALKASLITAVNIDALTLTVNKGTIGGWSIDSTTIFSDKVYIDSANNRIVVCGPNGTPTSGLRIQMFYSNILSYGFNATDSNGAYVFRLGSQNYIAGWRITPTKIFKNKVCLSEDGSIYNDSKWCLNNTGAGYVAAGNILWDADGNVTFSEGVSLSWMAPISNISSALGGELFPKLTYISSTGIYTGTLTAAQVNAVGINASSITTGMLSADRIAAGSITSAKLDAASIKANIINTSYINGLSCTFTKGTIGGWNINTNSIYSDGIGTMGITPIQIRTVASGSGYWYTGAYNPFGISMLWHQSSNAGHIVFGQISASGSTVKTGYIGLQMMSWDGCEYFCLSANAAYSGGKSVYNRIAGWAFDNANIWKNSVYLGSDGSIYNGTKWRLNNDGSGRMANGNIVWDAAGNVTFGSSVSLNWTNAATNALNSAKSYADVKKTEAINTAATDATTKADTAKELASAMAYGKMMYRDPTFFEGTNSVNLYNNLSNGTVTVARTNYSTAPNDGQYVLKIVNIGSASPGCGGFTFVTMCSYRKVLITRILAKIPSGRTIQWASNSIGDGGWSKWLTPNVGTGDWCEYVYKVVCGTANFSSTNFFYIEGTTPLTWYVAYATVFDVTSTERYTTTIDANGIYTGSLTANQITTGTLSADRIAAGSITSSKLDATSIMANIINTTYINGLSCTFNKGTIGGWNINSSQIYKNSVALSSDGSIVNGTKWKLNNDGSGQLANGNITWDTTGNITARGAVFNNVRIQGSVRNPFVLNDSSIWVGGDSSNQQNFNNYDNIIAVRGSYDENIALPWTLANSGRRVTLVNYKWGSNTTEGYMSISAPYGKYFYEDGIAKSSITFSREVIELLGYGDSSTFFGWIVTNRRDIMTSGRYGNYLQVLASGQVTASGTYVSMKQLTYDGSKMSISRTGEGRYTIYLPWSLNSNYIVQMTGYYTGGTPIYATIYGLYSSYFYVQTQDDPSANEGSFCFQVFSTSNWTT